MVHGESAHFRMTASHPPIPPPVTYRLPAAWEADIADPVSGFFMLRREILEGAELLDTALDAVGLEVILVDVSPNGMAGGSARSTAAAGECPRAADWAGLTTRCIEGARAAFAPHISVLRCPHAARREAAAADAGDPGERAD